MSRAAGFRSILGIGVGMALGSLAGAENFVVGQGPVASNPNRVKVFLANGTPSSTDVTPYAYQGWGVNVAASDVAAGGFEEIVTGPGPGSSIGPHVRALTRTGQGINGVNFFAYGTLRGGVNVAAGRVDAADEIVTGAGLISLFGPHVRGYSYDGSPVKVMSNLNFYAYSTLRFGVNVAVGRIDTDAFAEILTGVGPGATFGTHVRGWNYDGVGISQVPGCSFFAFGGVTGGVKVAAGDVNGDGDEEIVAGAAGQVAAFDYSGSVSALPGCTATGEGFGTGIVGGAVGDDLLVGDASTSVVRALSYDGTSTSQILSFTAFGASPKVTVTGGNLGF